MYSLRAATAADDELLYTIHRDAMGAYVEEMYGPWDDAEQRGFHERYVAAGPLVIDVDGDTVGSLLVIVEAGDVYVSRIEILTVWQGRGIGTAVLRDVMERARAEGRRVALNVGEVNPRARHLYERLGFQVTRTERRRHRMVWTSSDRSAD